MRKLSIRLMSGLTYFEFGCRTAERRMEKTCTMNLPQSTFEATQLEIFCLSLNQIPDRYL